MKAPMTLMEKVQLSKDLLGRLTQLREEVEALFATHLAAGTQLTAAEVTELREKSRAAQLDRMRIDGSNN
jgi:hypothetical protein